MMGIFGAGMENDIMNIWRFVFFNPFQNWTINSICIFYSKQACIIVVSSLGVLDPTPFMRPEAPKMIWQVKKFEKFPNDWYSKFSIMILFVLYVIYLSLVFFILCQHAYFKDNTNSRKCLMHWGINLLYILKSPFQFPNQPHPEKFQSSKKCVTLGWYIFVIFDTFLFFLDLCFQFLVHFASHPHEK